MLRAFKSKTLVILSSLAKVRRRSSVLYWQWFVLFIIVFPLRNSRIAYVSSKIFLTADSNKSLRWLGHQHLQLFLLNAVLRRLGRAREDQYKSNRVTGNESAQKLIVAELCTSC
jgi:hypothetical protein